MDKQVCNRNLKVIISIIALTFFLLPAFAAAEDFSDRRYQVLPGTQLYWDDDISAQDISYALSAAGIVCNVSGGNENIFRAQCMQQDKDEIYSLLLTMLGRQPMQPHGGSADITLMYDATLITLSCSPGDNIPEIKIQPDENAILYHGSSGKPGFGWGMPRDILLNCHAEVDFAEADIQSLTCKDISGSGHAFEMLLGFDSNDELLSLTRRISGQDDMMAVFYDTHADLKTLYGSPLHDEDWDFTCQDIENIDNHDEMLYDMINSNEAIYYKWELPDADVLLEIFLDNNSELIIEIRHIRTTGLLSY